MARWRPADRELQTKEKASAKALKKSFSCPRDELKEVKRARRLVGDKVRKVGRGQLRLSLARTFYSIPSAAGS